MGKKVGIGIIGTGFARKVQIPGFLKCVDTSVVSIASGNLANAESAAYEFNIDHFTPDWRETVFRDDVDLVVITTPPNLHKEMALAAIEAGKHVLCEKPMAMNMIEAGEMLAAARRSPKLALIDFELRFQPGRQKAFEMIRDGAIGKIRHAKYNFRAPHRGDPNIEWNWWSDIEQGGGALGAINSHIVDSFRWFLGSEISSVLCQLQTHVKRRPHDGGFRGVTTDDENAMILRFSGSELADDATGLVSVSMVEQPEYVNRLELFGTEGAIRIEHRGEVFLARNADREWTRIDVDLGSNIDGVPDTGFARAFNFFAEKVVEAIIAGKSSIEHAATFEDGVAVQRVQDAARESNANGNTIAL
ncbi:MAG TPA: Gfo/Idh/MocA family oxidoreductase [Pyrinomonadaceae bacterium]|nr:Gfo/Idh/MocA family oxidoreductase [Pyrinomonadaceae bacterium]